MLEISNEGMFVCSTKATEENVSITMKGCFHTRDVSPVKGFLEIVFPQWIFGEFGDLTRWLLIV
jgi:hypothetical protein